YKNLLICYREFCRFVAYKIHLFAFHSFLTCIKRKKPATPQRNRRFFTSAPNLQVREFFQKNLRKRTEGRSVLFFARALAVTALAERNRCFAVTTEFTSFGFQIATALIGARTAI